MHHSRRRCSALSLVILWIISSFRFIFVNSFCSFFIQPYDHLVWTTGPLSHTLNYPINATVSLASRFSSLVWSISLVSSGLDPVCRISLLTPSLSISSIPSFSRPTLVYMVIFQLKSVTSIWNKEERGRQVMVDDTRRLFRLLLLAGLFPSFLLIFF